ncbi:hypothetical protein AOCH_003533 [Aspergillus ochraceoroseus]|uniref:UBC core domain-containing protein n=2 Tax=Aspergillus ochraceoroseus TaxID=138278 RepID=A0A0F8UW81_9EURO|nr:hypothetical protein AOCH_003533 [Aspergillus ochraceoroseus]
MERVSKLRRLAADHAALHEELPPNYLFPPEDASDDLTQLTTLLAGPQGTPYSQGLWRLHLKIPEDYPTSPPKATFKTRIWHPNVEESTGAVCVDTLKRDWKSTLTLKDVLITISCLLIYPNPDSALNSTSGALLQENYDAFARQAKLMTSIHAPVPAELRTAALEAKMRGEESDTTIPEQEEASRCLRSRQGARIQSLTMKKKTGANRKDTGGPSQLNDHYESSEQHPHHQSEHIDSSLSDGENDNDNENENPSCSTKENDPSLSPSPVKLAPPSPRKNAHGKRPLSVLTMSMDPDPFAMDTEDIDADGMTPSERNIAANISPIIDPRDRDRDSSPQRKSPKLSLLNRGGINASGRIREDLKIYEDIPSDPSHPLRHCTTGHGKENRASSKNPGSFMKKSHPPHLSASVTSSAASSLSAALNSTSSRISRPSASTRKVSSSSMKKVKPRIGIRRL